MKAFAWLGVALLLLGLGQVTGFTRFVPCAGAFGVCLDPLNGIENILLGVFFVGIGGVLLVVGRRRR